MSILDAQTDVIDRFITYSSVYNRAHLAGVLRAVHDWHRRPVLLDSRDGVATRCGPHRRRLSRRRSQHPGRLQALRSRQGLGSRVRGDRVSAARRAGIRGTPSQGLNSQKPDVGQNRGLWRVLAGYWRRVQM